jgi:hypothetical protein
MCQERYCYSKQFVSNTNTGCISISYLLKRICMVEHKQRPYVTAARTEIASRRVCQCSAEQTDSSRTTAQEVVEPGPRVPSEISHALRGQKRICCRQCRLLLHVKPGSSVTCTSRHSYETSYWEFLHPSTQQFLIKICKYRLFKLKS